MRPLVVLGLVIVAVLVLILALVRTGESRDRAPLAGPPSEVAATPPVASAVDAPSIPQEDAATERLAHVPATASETERAALPGAPTSYANELAGTVSNPEGLPVADAEVTLGRRGMSGELAPLGLMMGAGTEEGPRRTTKTDAEGRYSLRSIDPATDYSLVVEHADYARMELPNVQVEQTGTTLRDVRLDQGYTVHGYVWDHLGARPLAGAEIELIPALFASLPNLAQIPQSGYVRFTAVSREDGFYRITNVPPGTRRSLSCRATGFGTQSEANLAFEGPVDKPVVRDFRLRPGMSITGRMRLEDGTKVAGGSVEALFFGPGQNGRGHAASDAEGRFEVADLCDGSYMLIATAPGCGDWRQNGIAAGTANVDIVLSQQGSISGRVISDATGEPLVAFQCSLRLSLDGQERLGRAIQTQDFTNAADGRFVLPGVASGSYVVQAAAPGFAPTYSDPFEVAEGRTTEDVVVRMTKGGTLVGRVLDEKTGNPLAGARVSTFDNNHQDNQLFALLGALVPRTTTQSTTLTDAKGDFELALLMPEVYQVRVDFGTYTQQIKNDVRVIDGTSVEIPPFRLTTGAVVRGTVYGSDGKPLQGATVQMRGASDGTSLPLSYFETTDAEGRYAIHRVASGSFTIHASGSAGAASGDPFRLIIEQKQSETSLVVVEGREYVQELYLGG